MTQRRFIQTCGSGLLVLLLSAALGTVEARTAERASARAETSRAQPVKAAKGKKAATERVASRGNRLSSGDARARKAVVARARGQLAERTVQARVDERRRPAGKASALRRAAVAAPVVAAAAAAAPALSFGQQQGLHDNPDPLDLRSSVALVVDQDTNEVLFAKNANAVLPIASITKLMTALVVTEARQSLDDVLTITGDDIDTEKNSRSRLTPGTQLSRGEMLHLALMSSENRAANALGRHYPGGLPAFVQAMNRKAAQLGMRDTHYVEPTGLSSHNQSSARDLAVLVKEAHRYPLLRELSTSPEAQVEIGHRTMAFHNTNGLIRSPNWEIGLQKTGYISEAGRCLVMQAQLAGRKLIMVLLDSAGKYSRMGDAERIRRWLDTSSASLNPARPQRGG